MFCFDGTSWTACAHCGGAGGHHQWTPLNLRTQAAPAHVCASDNTICTLRAGSPAGRRDAGGWASCISNNNKCTATPRTFGWFKGSSNEWRGEELQLTAGQEAAVFLSGRHGQLSLHLQWWAQGEERLQQKVSPALQSYLTQGRNFLNQTQVGALFFTCQDVWFFHSFVLYIIMDADTENGCEARRSPYVQLIGNSKLSL